MLLGTFTFVSEDISLLNQLKEYKYFELIKNDIIQSTILDVHILKILTANGLRHASGPVHYHPPVTFISGNGNQKSFSTISTSIVVYFDQCLGAAHSKCPKFWSKYTTLYALRLMYCRHAICRNFVFRFCK